MKRSMGTLQMREIEYGDMFPFEVVIIYKKDGLFRDMIHEASEEYPELFKLDEDAIEKPVVSFVFSDSDSSKIYMFMTDSLDVEILVHEVIHLTFRAFDKIGADVCEETEEFFAYINQKLFKDVFSTIRDIFKLKLPLSRA